MQCLRRKNLTASGESGNHYPWNTMSTEPRGPRPLREIEMEVEAEGREWTRQRLQQRLQEEAQRHGEVFPPQRPTPHSPAHPPDATADRRRGR